MGLVAWCAAILVGYASALDSRAATARFATALVGSCAMITTIVPMASAMPPKKQAAVLEQPDWTADVKGIPDPPFKELLEVTKVEAKTTGKAIWERFKRQVIGWFIQRQMHPALVNYAIKSRHKLMLRPMGGLEKPRTSLDVEFEREELRTRAYLILAVFTALVGLYQQWLSEMFEDDEAPIYMFFKLGDQHFYKSGLERIIHLRNKIDPLFVGRTCSSEYFQPRWT